MKNTLELHQVSKVFQSAESSVTALLNVSFELQEGESCALVGPSGSGKSTFLNLCAGLEQPTSGRVILSGRDLNNLSEDELSTVRNRELGFIFQSFQLLAPLTALENVLLPAELGGDYSAEPRAREWLKRVGLSNRLTHLPSELSGGEQQRVAIARAFINRPGLIIADEPTGNLDFETAQSIRKLLFDLNREEGTALLIATHDATLAEQTGRQVTLRGGQSE